MSLARGSLPRAHHGSSMCPSVRRQPGCLDDRSVGRSRVFRPLATAGLGTSNSDRRRFLRALIAAGAAPLVAQPSFAASFENEQASSLPSFLTKNPADPPTFVKATGRVVSIGDLHGDLDKSVRAFVAANVMVMDAERRPVWVGGDTVVVQLGDVLDRGPDEIRIVMLLRELDRQARQQGGAVYMLNGNHESLNICGNFRYVTTGAFFESAEYAGVWPYGREQPADEAERMQQLKTLADIRLQMYRPGGPMALELSKNPTILVVNDTAFAHGGLLPTHVAYGIERLNAEVAAWMRNDKAPNDGHAPPPFLAMGDAKSVMWTRALSREVFSPHERFQACRALGQALDRIGAKRLVVGHTPQLGGCNCECQGQVWRIDVGMSSGVLNKPVQILEMQRDSYGDTIVKVLGEDGLPLTSDQDADAMGSIFPNFI